MKRDGREAVVGGDRGEVGDEDVWVRMRLKFVMVEVGWEDGREWGRIWVMEDTTVAGGMECGGGRGL